MRSFEHVTLSFSLPRSRSQWLAWVYGQAIESWHDPLKFCEHPLDLRRRIVDRGEPNRNLFIADTSAILFHEALRASLPGARFLYVVRPRNEVADSVRRQTGFFYNNRITAMSRRLEREASAAPSSSTCAYVEVGAFAKEKWPDVCGPTVPPKSAAWWLQAYATHIDVPVRKQSVYPVKRYHLMRHIEVTW